MTAGNERLKHLGAFSLLMLGRNPLRLSKLRHLPLAGEELPYNTPSDLRSLMLFRDAPAFSERVVDEDRFTNDRTVWDETPITAVEAIG